MDGVIRVSAMIPTHNRRDRVVRAVDHLVRQEFPAERLEIIVALDRCTDGTMESLREAFGDRVLVLDSPRPGGSAALNTAVAAASGEICITLDDEMQASPQFVAAHVEAHERSAGRNIVVTGYSPVLLTSRSPALHRYLAAGYDAFHDSLARGEGTRSPASVNLGNMSIRTDALRSVNGFDESFFFQRNDFELAARLLENGFEVHYCPEARADQDLAVTGSTMVSRAEPRAVNDVRLLKEHPWCAQSLPFRRQLENARAARKWRALWLGRSVIPRILAGLRKLNPENVTLVRLEYAARYCVGVVTATGGWSGFTTCRRVAGA